MRRRTSKDQAAAGLTFSEEQLWEIAVKRGCNHYAPMVIASGTVDPGGEILPHEFLGCLLLASDYTAPKRDPFNSFRIGAMVLSDLSVRAGKILEYVPALQLDDALTHLAMLGHAHDEMGCSLWRKILDGLPGVAGGERSSRGKEADFPGLSRLTIETYTRPLRLQTVPSRTWLRTDFGRQ